jgi:hypothetical protein
VYGSELEAQGLSSAALYELSVLQHVHYYSTYTCFHPSEPVPNSRDETDKYEEKNENKNENRNGQLFNGYSNQNVARMHNNYSVNSIQSRNEFSKIRKKSKNRENYENGNLGSVCISAPLGIISLPSSTSLPSATEQNILFSLLGGQFGTISMPINNNINNNGNNNNNNNKLNSNYTVPTRFLAFMSVHLSLSSVLPLILSHAQLSFEKNIIKKDDNNNAKNTKYYGAGFLAPNNGENKPITEEILPPISAYFARDLCLDLFSATDHCIQW